MARTYSTHEAKARLSELLDLVRSGVVVTITDQGEPVAELRPVAASETAVTERLDDLRSKGIITARKSTGLLKPIARRDGALERFLASRE